MDLSGIIFVALALVWAGYLIPKALKHHDDVARTRSVDRFSTAMRVLARREPVSRRDARLVVTPARAADNPRVLAPRSRVAVRPEVRRAAARAAARRRRRILSFLLVCDLLVAVLAAVGVLALWAPVLPVTLTLLYLVLCRTQVRREHASTWESKIAAAADAPADEVVEAPRRGARVDAPHGAPVEIVAERNEQGFEEFSPMEDTVTIPAAVLDAVAVPTDDGGSLWDPLPMTLPTYVTKPKARRTVRTIDLSEPGAWTSGRTAADAELVQAAAGEAAATEAATDEQRAVGS